MEAAEIGGKLRNLPVRGRKYVFTGNNAGVRGGFRGLREIYAR